MTTYVFAVVLRALSEDQVDAVAEIDGVIRVGATAGINYVEFEFDGDMPESHVDGALNQLRSKGLEPVRIDPDLVTTSAIAERADVSRQAVRLWVEGERREGFPMPYSPANGQRIWMWSDVYPWLVAHGIPLAPEYSFAPLATQLIVCFNGYLADPNGPYLSPAEKSKEKMLSDVFTLVGLYFDSSRAAQVPGFGSLHWSAPLETVARSQRLDQRAPAAFTAGSRNWKGVA